MHGVIYNGAPAHLKAIVSPQSSIFQTVVYTVFILHLYEDVLNHRGAEGLSHALRHAHTAQLDVRRLPRGGGAVEI